MQGRRKYWENLLNRLTDNQTNYINNLLEGNYDAALTFALKIGDEQPQYALLHLYMQLPSSKKLFLLFLQRVSVIDPFLVYEIIGNPAFRLDELSEILARTKGSGFIYTAIKKRWFLRKNTDIAKETNCDSLAAELESLLEEIDDFELYEFAIRHSIVPKERKGTNYSWYLLLRDSNKSIALSLLKRSTDFDDIAKILGACNFSTKELRNYDILCRYLAGGYSESLLVEMVGVFQGEQSFLNTKILLALLIASRDERNLVLAFYLSYKGGFMDNYEIDLVHMFLSRYFCMPWNVVSLMKQLDIKNVQVYNNAFLWSDPVIVTGKILHSPLALLSGRIKDDKMIIRRTLREYIDQNRIWHAAELMKLNASFETYRIIDEVERMEFLETNPVSQYSSLLGAPCRYMFDKLVKGHVRAGGSCLESLYSTSNGTDPSELLNNRFMPIDSADFIEYFNKLVCDKNRRAA